MKVVRFFHRGILTEKSRLKGRARDTLQANPKGIPEANLIKNYYYFRLNPYHSEIRQAVKYPVFVMGEYYNISGRVLKEDENPKIKQLLNF